MAQEHGPFWVLWTTRYINVIPAFSFSQEMREPQGKQVQSSGLQSQTHICRYQGGRTFSIYLFREEELLFTSPKTFPTLIPALFYILENLIYPLITPIKKDHLAEV